MMSKVISKLFARTENVLSVVLSCHIDHCIVGDFMY